MKIFIHNFYIIFLFRKFRTLPGALTSLLVIGTLIAYTVSRFSVMLSMFLLLLIIQ